MPQHVIHIPKGEDLAEWSIRRVLLPPDTPSPHWAHPHRASTAIPADWMEVRMTIHAGLVEWMEALALQLVDAGSNSAPLMDFSRLNNLACPQVLEPLDGHDLEAWNLEYCETPHYNGSPSLRLNQPWHAHLGFLRLFTKTKYLTRKFRVRMSSTAEHEQLWSHVYDDKLEEDCARVHRSLRGAFEALRHHHYAHPQTTTTTVTISRT
jgi:hypothetical protein